MENHPLIFHISGITDLYKEQLMNKLKNLNKFLIFNLDEETEKIYKLPEIQIKLKDINEVKTTTKKKLESDINDMWVIKINEYIKKIIKETETKNCFGIIFIGNTINMKFVRNKVTIPCYQKFFLQVNFEDNAKEIIKYNLKKHHDDIVAGVFPLNYISLDFLMNTREQLQYAYGKLGYNVSTIDGIVYYFQNGIHDKKPELLYVVLPDKYEKVINLKKKIYGFSEDWVALSSIANGIDRGYEDGLPYIKEKVKGAFKSLEVECYVYVVSSVNFLSVQNSKMKFVTDRPIKIIKSMEIENILNKLKELKINLR
jgi:hypothetical protein